MGWLEGLLTGYVDRRNEIETRNMKMAEDRAIREGQVYKDLLYSEDPVVKRMAQAGILELGQPRKRAGIAGWLGHMETSPTYKSLMEYERTPQSHTVYDDEPTPQQPGAPGGAIAQPAAPGAPLAQPATNAVEPGQPPLQPPIPTTGAAADLPMMPTMTPGGAPGASQMAAGAAQPPPSLPPELGLQGAMAPPPPPPQPGQTTSLMPPQTRKSRTMMERPNFYPTGAQIKGQQVSEEIEGTINGYFKMFKRLGQSDQEANDNAVELYQRTHIRGGAASGFAALKGETMGPDGKWTPAYGIKNNATGQVEEVLPDGTRRPFPGGFRPTGPANLMNFGAARNAAMAQLGVSPADMRSDPAKAAEVNALASQLAADQAYDTTFSRGQAGAVMPLSTADREKSMMSLRDDWRGRSTKVMDQISAVAQMKVAHNAAVNRGDIAAAAEAMTVLWQKGIDPGSVVRESEANRPVQFAGLSARVQGAWERWTKGGAAITLDELKKYVVLADEMAQAAALLVEDDRARIERIAVRQGIDPRDVVPPPLVNLPDTSGGGTGGPVVQPPPEPPPTADQSMSQTSTPFSLGAPGAVAPPTEAVPTPPPMAAPAPGRTDLRSPYVVSRDGKYLTPAPPRQ